MIDPELISQTKQNFLDALAVCVNLEQIELLKSEQLGKSGVVAARFKELASLDIDAKKAAGPLISDYKSFVESQIG